MKETSNRYPSLANMSSKLPGEPIGRGDSFIIHDFLPTEIHSNELLLDILNQVCWQKMQHASGEVPRLVCCQGDFDGREGTMPVYRHPSDSVLPLMHWSPSILRIRNAAQEAVGHPLNHAIIQLYRGGTDFISEHTDKTLDIAHGSRIVNVSLGAQRTMRLRSKRDAVNTEDPRPGRTTERVHLPHNSIFVMGLETNAHFLHGIQPDKRLPHDLSSAEMDFGGFRVSITLRQIATFISHDSQLIWGQGAVAKTRVDALPVVNGPSEACQDLIRAFGLENQTSHLAWSEIYGSGSNVLNLSEPIDPVDRPILFLNESSQEGEAVKAALEQIGVRTTIKEQVPILPRLSKSPMDTSALLPLKDRSLVFRDNNTLHTEHRGVSAVLAHLSRRHGYLVEWRLCSDNNEITNDIQGAQPDLRNHILRS